jgi:hypothetical protein
VGDLEMGASFNFGVDHDPFRKAVGLADNAAVASLLIDVTYVRGDHVLR